MRREVIIWFAILNSTVIYAVLIYVLTNGRTRNSFDAALRNPVVIPLYALALAAFLAGTVYSIVARDRPQQLRMIVSLALYEACAIFGLIAAFLAQDWRLFLAPWAVAIIGFVRMYPSTMEAQ